MKNLNIDEIIRLYFDEKMSIENIGKRFGVSPTPIRDRLLSQGYELRPSYWKAHQTRRAMFTESEQAEMVELHVEKELSSDAIAAIFRTSGVTVQKYLKKAGVLRTRKEAQALRKQKKRVDLRPLEPTESPEPENVLRLRSEEHLKIDEIAERTGLSRVEVFRIIG